MDCIIASFYYKFKEMIFKLGNNFYKIHFTENLKNKILG